MTSCENNWNNINSDFPDLRKIVKVGVTKNCDRLRVYYVVIQ